MKFISILPLIIFAILLSHSNALTTESFLKENAPTVPASAQVQKRDPLSTDKVAVDMSSEWKVLFSNSGDRPSEVCERNAVHIMYKLEKSDEQDQLSGLLPMAKENIHYKYQGFNQSAMMFDLLDNVSFELKNPILEKFSQLWDMMIKTPPDTMIQDKYEPLAIFGIYANNNPLPSGLNIQEYGKLFEQVSAQKKSSNVDIKTVYLPAAEEAKIYNALNKYNPSYSEEAVNSVKMTQLPAIYKALKIPIATPPGWYKKELDKYDFNGDGRLSAFEALFMVIWTAGERLDTDELFKKVSKEVIDPIFKYADCDKDGYIFAEGLFKTLKNMQVKNDQFDIFKCVHPKSKQYQWTSSVNDFILKNASKYIGYMDINEFRRGILLGFWDRQVKKNTIDKGNEFNMKNLRWENGVDLQCPYKGAADIRSQ